MKARRGSALYNKPRVDRPIHLATGIDELRPPLHNVYFERGMAYATDAHIAVRIPLNEVFVRTETLPPDGTCLTREQFEMISGQDLQITEEGILLTDFDALIKFKKSEEFKIGGRPVPDAIDYIFGEHKEPVAVTEMGLSSVLFARMAKIVKDPIMRCYFCGTNRAIRLKDNEGRAYAIIMPTMIPSAINPK